MENLIITDEYIDFSLFSDIERKITICLYRNHKLLINIGHQHGLCKYCVTLDEQYRLYDTIFVKIFKERNINNNTSFYKHKDTYYEN